MPAYDYHCSSCDKDYEAFQTLADYDKPTLCPVCMREGQKVIRSRQTSPSFTEKLYPYWDKALNKVFNNPSERKTYLNEKGWVEKGSGSMTKKQEREMYEMRIGNHDPRDRRHAN